MFGKKTDPEAEIKAGPEPQAREAQTTPQPGRSAYRDAKPGGRSPNGPVIGDVSRRMPEVSAGRRDGRTVTDFRTADLRSAEGRGGDSRASEARGLPEGRGAMEARGLEGRGMTDGEMRKLTVGRDIVLQGEIRACQKLVVEGTVEAQLNGCRSVEIAQSGLFKGSAQIETADISGRFEGDITVTNRLIVRSTGRIVGSIQYGQIEIERGGVVSGHVEVLPTDATTAAGWAAADQASQSAEAAVI